MAKTNFSTDTFQIGYNIVAIAKQFEGNDIN